MKRSVKLPNEIPISVCVYACVWGLLYFWGLGETGPRGPEGAVIIEKLTLILFKKNFSSCKFKFCIVLHFPRKHSAKTSQNFEDEDVFWQELYVVRYQILIPYFFGYKTKIFFPSKTIPKIYIHLVRRI